MPPEGGSFTPTLCCRFNVPEVIPSLSLVIQKLVLTIPPLPLPLLKLRLSETKSLRFEKNVMKVINGQTGLIEHDLFFYLLFLLIYPYLFISYFNKLI